MFFVKSQINKDTVLQTEITDENVFTLCPECGDEVQVDLTELAADGELDLYATAICCPVCSKRRWAELETADDANEECDIDIPVLLDSISQSVNCLRWAFGKAGDHGD